MLKHLSLCLLILLCVSCEKAEKQTKEKVGSPPEKIVERNLKLEATLTHASIQVSRALKSGLGEMVRINRIALVNNPSQRASFLQSDSKILSLVFAANIHGERIDCGCRKNPLGGLARHETLVEEVGQDGKLWDLPANKNLLSLDAGDVFFKNVFDDVVEKKGETPAIYNAKSVAAARKLMQLDVQNIGELDLVFGLATLKELVEISGKKVVSANLYQEGKRIFEPFQIIEKGTMKIAVIGLTKQKSRKNDFFKSRNIESRDALEEYNKVRASLPKVDLVVLLSNLGIPNTRILVSKVARLPDLVVVSNSNRMTKAPIFERGVPMIEPGSRGKYFGRADLILNGNEVGFANSGETKVSRLDAYSRTYRNYLSARIRYLRQIEKAQRSVMDPDENKSHSQTDHHHSAQTHEHKKDPKKFMKNAAVLQKQMATLANTLSTQAASLDVEAPTSGDDYINMKMAPVKLDIVEQKKVKKLITKREKKAPQVKKRSLPKR